MHYFKRCFVIPTAAVIAVSPVCMTQYTANAADAPADVHLTVETKEIDIEDIPGDRTVSLNIYLENCPPFYSISFGVSKDPRLEFYNDLKCFEKAEGMVNASKPSGGSYAAFPDYRCCFFGALGDGTELVQYDNAIVTITFVLPEQVSPGDFFGVELPRRFESDVVNLSMSMDIADYFEDTPFTQLNGGGIRITQRNQSPPPSGDNGGSGGNSGGGEAQSGGGGNEPQTGGGNDNTPSQDSGSNNSPAPTEAVNVTATAVTVMTTYASSSESTTTTTGTSETTTTTTEASSTTSSKSTSAAVTTGAPDEPEKRNTGGLKTIGIITLVIAAVCSISILAARLRMK